MGLTATSRGLAVDHGEGVGSGQLPKSVVSSSRGPLVNPVPSSTYGPLVTRDLNDGHPAGTYMGIAAGTQTLNSVSDPAVALGYWGAVGSEPSILFQLEADGKYGATADHLMAAYVQVIRSDGTTNRFPFNLRYDRTLQAMVDLRLQIGPGQDAFGNAGGNGFRLGWDDGTNGGDGSAVFVVKQATADLYYGGATGINPTLSVHSPSGQNAILQLYSGAGGADSNVHWVYANGANQLTIQVNGHDHSHFFNGGSNAACLSIGAIDNGSALTVATTQNTALPTLTARAMASQSVNIFQVQNSTPTNLVTIDSSGGLHPGNSTGIGGALWDGSGVPASGLGSNGDYYLRTDTPGTANQRIYVKSAGAWVGIL